MESWLERNKNSAMDEFLLKEILKTVSISFVLEDIDRIQSTLICELRDSYVQQSQRYVALAGETYTQPNLDEEDNAKARLLFAEAGSLYGEMSRLKDPGFKGRPQAEHYIYGIPIEDARYILPLAVKTNVCTAMSGDKLFEFFRLLRDGTYGDMFSALAAELAGYLPPALVCLLPGEYDSGFGGECAEDFYRDYFAEISAENNLVYFDGFAELTRNVGLGALTSTSADPPSLVLEKWGSDADSKARGVVERVLGYGHESIAEQARTTFGLMCSLAAYHQQLRHRLFQNRRESLSALIWDKDREVKTPESIKRSVFYPEFQRIVRQFKEFRIAAARKYGEDKALLFLLNCDQIKLITSANARADAMMLKDRTCMNAQWEIRDLALKKLACLRKLSGVLYEKALPACVFGKCREGKLTCGRQAEVRARFSAGG